jgi:hypothetical protein
MIFGLVVGLALIMVCIILWQWRVSVHDSQLRRLSAGWPSAAFWFGAVLLFLVMARVESIQFVAMRVWPIVWLLSLLGYVFWQVRRFRQRHYSILPRPRTEDPRGRYLPGKKR